MSQNPQTHHNFGASESVHPRTSPMGQSSSTTPSQTSSQSPNSPGPQRPASHVYGPAGPPDRRPAVPGNLDRRTPGLTEEYRQSPYERLSGPAASNDKWGSSYTTNGQNGNVPPHENRPKTPTDTMNGPNSLYAQVNFRDSPSHLRDRSNSRERSQSPSRRVVDDPNTRGQFSGPPEGLPPKRDSMPSPRRGHPALNIQSLNPAQPQIRETIEMQSLRSSDMLGGMKRDSNPKPLPKDYPSQPSHYQTASSMTHRAPQLTLPQPKWRGSLASEDGQYSPSLSSRSVTPPLPPLSPADTPPITPPESPQMGRHLPQSMPPGGIQGYLTRTPDVVTSTAKKNSPGGGGKKKQTKRALGGGVAVKTWDGRMKRSVPNGKTNGRITHTQAYRNARSRE